VAFQDRFAGKEKKLTFGAYPTITLTETRQRREEAKRLLANGVDPGEIRKARKEEAFPFSRVSRHGEMMSRQIYIILHSNSSNFYQPGMPFPLTCLCVRS
jgi:Arm DNA-binding domain